MRLELPEGYRHVAPLAADARITGCHVVDDHRLPLPKDASKDERRERGRLVMSLCNEPIDTRHPDGGGLAPYGTLWPDVPGDWLAWPCTCSSCALELVRRVLHIPYDGMGAQQELFGQFWDERGRIDVKAKA